MADSGDTLRRYLADHDVPCPACGYNLRGLEGETCPECGDAVALRAYPDAERLDDRERTALYLKYHDLACRHCKTGLRGTDGTCPGCGRRHVARGLPTLEPLREPGPPRRRAVAGRTVFLAAAAALVLLVLLVLLLAAVLGP